MTILLINVESFSSARDLAYAALAASVFACCAVSARSCTLKRRKKRYGFGGLRRGGDCRKTDRERECSWFCTQMARPERFELPTPRFVVWGRPLKSLRFVPIIARVCIHSHGFNDARVLIRAAPHSAASVIPHQFSKMK